MKLVQERAGNTLELIGIGNNFLNKTQMAQQLGEKIDRWDYMKFKKLLYDKRNGHRLKRQLTEWEKIFASYTSNKGLRTRIYRELKKLHCPKISDPMKKWLNEVNRAFSKEEVQMEKKKAHEEMLKIPGNKENANQNNI
jgi:hypothetical protein